METEEDAGEGAEMEAHSVSTVAIAVSGSKNSRHALKWALDKFVPGGRVLLRILYVRWPIRMVSTPMGNTHKLLPYKKMCAQRQVEAVAVLLESDDVPAAKRRNQKIQHLQVSLRFFLEKHIPKNGSTHMEQHMYHSTSLLLPSRRASPSGSAGSEISYHDDTALTSLHSITSEAQFSSSSSGNSIYKSFRRDDFPDTSDQPSVSETATNLNHSQDQGDLKLEIERLRVKLRHLQKLHEFPQNELVDASQKGRFISSCYITWAFGALRTKLGLKRLNWQKNKEELNLSKVLLKGKQHRVILIKMQMRTIKMQMRTKQERKLSDNVLLSIIGIHGNRYKRRLCCFLVILLSVGDHMEQSTRLSFSIQLQQ